METPNLVLLNNDCILALKELPDNSIDSVVTDPPYELGFMGRSWDSTGIAYNQELWKEVLRVLKPGGHLLSFGGTKTYHRMACAIEDSGFEIRDCIQWIYGTGMPHGDNISKRIDKIQGAKRGKVRIDASQVRNTKVIDGGHGIQGGDRPYMQKALEVGYHELDDNNPITEDAKKWDGWNTALKPANEPIVVAQKPLSEKGYALNVLKYGTGALNIEASKIKNLDGVPVFIKRKENSKNSYGDGLNGSNRTGEISFKSRWPANLILSEQSAESLGDYSKIFYVAKASKSEKGDFNKHPTVKPLKLMEYLVTLVTPPNGTVLDPFMGSGTTGVAALNKGFKFIGIEKEKESFNTANKRIAPEQEAPRG